MWRSSSFLLLAFTLTLGAAPAPAAPLFLLSFDEPDGVAGPNDVLPMLATVEIDSASDVIVFDSGGELFTAGGESFRFTLFISRGTFFPDYEFNFGVTSESDIFAEFAGLTLNPGDTVSIVFGRHTPPPGGATPGTYAISSAAVRLLDPSFGFIQDFSASNGFQRTVPEPGAGAQLAAVALALIVLRRSRSRC